MTAATVAQAVDGLPQRLSGLSAFRWLAPASTAGISAALGVVAAVWFTAGQPSGAIGAVALCASYLAGRPHGGWVTRSSGRGRGPPQSARRPVSGVAVEARSSPRWPQAHRAGQPGLWRLAIIVLILLTIRQVACVQRPNRTGRGRRRWRFVWRVLAFPPGGQILLSRWSPGMGARPR
jgi:hypothetical protein